MEKKKERRKEKGHDYGLIIMREWVFVNEKGEGERVKSLCCGVI